MASTKPNQFRATNCHADLAEIQSEPVDLVCQQKWEAQRLVLQEAGITLTSDETANW